MTAIDYAHDVLDRVVEDPRIDDFLACEALHQIRLGLVVGAGTHVPIGPTSYTGECSLRAEWVAVRSDIPDSPINVCQAFKDQVDHLFETDPPKTYSISFTKL